MRPTSRFTPMALFPLDESDAVPPRRALAWGVLSTAHPDADCAFERSQSFCQLFCQQS
jgi:hypothetical protein